MKLLKLTTLFLLGITTTALSQRPQKHDLKFNYTQLPSAPLDAAIVNYTSTVNLMYVDAINEEKAKALAEYEAEMADYPRIEQQAKANYDERLAQYKVEKEAYDNKSAGKKFIEKNVLEENTKPSNPGSYYPPAKPYLREIKSQKVFNQEMLSNTYLKLEGFNLATENAVIITVDMYGYEGLDPEFKTEKRKMFNSKTKAEYYDTYTWYETSYKHPMNLKIETPDGQVLFNETFTEFNDFIIAKTKETKGSSQAMNRESYVKSLQDKAVTQNLKIINAFINDNYGYRVVERKSTIYSVKEKKHDYSDYKSAFISANDGYSLLVSDFEAGSVKLKEAIVLWETALKESDTEDKKARINQKVTLVTYYNLIDAYIALNEFSKAESVLNKLAMESDKKKETNKIDEYKLYLKDIKDRWEINNG